MLFRSKSFSSLYPPYHFLLKVYLKQHYRARRLHTIMEKLLEDVSFELPDSDRNEIVIDCEYVKEKFAETIRHKDLDKYIL